jgi:uncharacterized OB-fold protein
MSILDKFEKIFLSLATEDYFIISEEPQTHTVKYNKKLRKKKYKDLKYICDKCGAYNHKYQGVCGICMSSHLRKATKKEIEHTISMLESY